ncbi:putative mitochondrial mitochondrial carrier protein [Leptomonas pyrrhocoris]|uniref:Putative mitochondrial mitochondrial carrier protein n=1 Tax=Leptomonas pyrrhocoris TaxID=157538 RepID=A0A0M9FS80_LEPPY|nr:putative mitochondrial mitochondrial carrier protein [Leptomonas pyrrhocoris]XP_015652254.1 putative mitochondrial mitochondrial carrier protein [Leptomonas pyrrhocoris]XP_015653434.1 putative mitochondrial mitochondrial carrier protein [Leptomonas pyrrhocoris]XP_015653435.1 putative mitochondrial mitochondrial carrier protein [Leptomonas pyrrhocoris]KPA73814.1 putative mitochondrial mitochondrial carrier protein [Leptomonas pyrrhocoris]KPA73815.1 putative mitochondrial mitochondrial carrie|eukprot:XP_015652253.1 putative mitochondrial mitochondrial carrier protein [Leptomonas pyrrhocoris]
MSAATTAPATERSFSDRFIRSHAGAATGAGILEIAFFHPFDTTAKRLMANKGSISRGSIGGTAANLNQIIFKQHAHDGLLRKVMYLYPGSLYAVVYKVFQRVYKFAGQPYVRDFLSANYRQSFTRWFGKANKVMEDAMAGCLIGLGEVFLLPLDRLKVLSQTNERAMRKGLLPLLRQEGVRGMYAGTAVTMCRNAPGSFCLFGGTAFTKGYVFGLSDYRSATLFQNMCASTVGACLSIAVSNPMDVVKTRVQFQTEGERRNAVFTATAMLREEGVTSFFKGLTPKIVASAPKLIFAYTMTEYFFKLMNPSKAH